MNNSFLPIQPSDFSYSQIRSSPINVEPAPSANMSSLPSALFLAVWIAFACIMIWYRKHRIHHFRIKQQRAMLERMWQLSSTK